MTAHAGYASRRVLVDTSACYALTDADETDHSATRRVREQLIGEQRPLFTTNFVLAETHALVPARLGRIPRQVLSAIEQSHTTVVRVSVRDESRARAIIDRYDDKNVSLTDALSFAVMERPGIPTAFTLDHNFAQYGFALLPEEESRR